MQSQEETQWEGARDPEGFRNTHWETIPAEEVLGKLGTTAEGLSKERSASRLTGWGSNQLPEEKERGPIVRFLLQFHNALIYVLLAATVLTAVMQHWLDTWVILGVVILNAIIGYVQEDKAKKALDAIRHMLSPRAAILRNGKRTEIPAEDLVPGDIVLLKAGDKVPADLRLLEVSRMAVEEASLTGESEAVTKSVEPVEKGTVLGERVCMTYTGTTVQAGEATGVVIATGADTELGKINTMLSSTESVDTPLIRSINKFGQKLSFFIIGFSGLVFFYGWFVMKDSLENAALSVIGLAVAAIPEGLPAILTITLAIGVQRMARRNAIIRRLPSVETLGSVTVICSDKTGTLTKNEMTVTTVDTADASYDVEGTGYQPEGQILLDGKPVELEKEPALSRMLTGSYLCNDAHVDQDEKDQWVVRGTPTEGALMTLSLKGGMGGSDSPRLGGIPFDSAYKYKASLHELDGTRILFVNGAPDRLLDMCGQQLTAEGPTPLDTAFWDGRIEENAGEGLRMLGIAYREMDDNRTEIDHEDMTDLVFLGVAGLLDPPRSEATEAIRVSRKAGIRVKMITGDHVSTARAIGSRMGIGDGEKVISGAELEEMDDAAMQEAVKDCDIFARTSPEHKLRLVTAIQANGDICAMTGDGVNDAPALKKADIGVAMGIKGTEVTKDAAAMVLADDNFASIAAAVGEGRAIYDNLRKTLLFMLPTNGAEALVILTAIFFGLALPITPVQILWVNMVTAVTLGIALAFEEGEQNAMERPPRNPKASILGGYFLFRILFVSVLIGAMTMGVFLFLQEQTGDLALARTVAVNTLVFGELFYLFNCRKLDETILGRAFFGNRVALMVSGILVLVQLAFTYLPFMNLWFGTTPVSAGQWLYPVVGGIIVLLVVEVEKKLTGRFRKEG